MTLPTGTVTFLFTDIEGSTKLAQEHPDKWESLQERHHAILHQAMQTNNGYVFQIIGDAFCVAFSTAVDALNAAVEAQKLLHQEAWSPVPIKVRMGIHTGEANLQTNGDYQGYLAMSRVQRLMSAGHGGQVLISQNTQELVCDELPEAITLSDMGERRLKDLLRPEHIYQLIIQNLPANFPPLKTLDIFHHNLPAQMTSFVGRVKEIADIKQALNGHRLVTLTGSGGTGKTRLSLQIAAELLDQFVSGIWFIELAPITDLDLVPQALLTTMGLVEQQGKTILQSLLDFLREKKILLVFDNCEHLIEACARLADALLSNTPTLRILASSREALGVTGEMAWRVPSLSLPDPKKIPNPDQLTRYEAVRLFVDRATLANPHFLVTKDNASALAQICHRLDGIPLALELAAARVKALSVDQISARLDDRFRLLTGGARTALPRQQTLRALIDWSYNLLSDKEKTLFRRLAVFVGGWNLEAVETVCVGENIESYEVLDLLTNLVEKSLVITEEVPDGIRYRRLETIRQYAREKFLETDEVGIVRQRHGDWFLQFAVRLDPKLGEKGVEHRFDQLEVEHDNLRAAFEWLLSTEPNNALQLASASGRFWLSRDHYNEGREVLRRARMAVSEATPELSARVLRWEGLLATNQGDYTVAKEYLLEALGLIRQVDEKETFASILNALGLTAWSQGDYEGARSYYEEALKVRRELGEKTGIATILANLGNIALSLGDHLAARRSHEESLAVYRELDEKSGQATSLNNLGVSLEALGEYETAKQCLMESIAIAREYKLRSPLGYALNSLAHLMLVRSDTLNAVNFYRESLVTFRELGEKRGLAYCLEGLAMTAVALGNAEHAVTLFASADALRNQMGAPLSATELAENEKALAVARSQLEESAFAGARSKGLGMTLDRALDNALQDST